MIRDWLLRRLAYYRCVNAARYTWPTRGLVRHWLDHLRKGDQP